MSGNKKIFFYGIFLTVLSLGLSLYPPRFLTFLENKLYDTLHHSLEYKALALPLIVDIDEKSIEELGQWPWSRHQVARLLKKISDSGAAAIGVDILFSEPDRTSLNQVRKEILSQLGLDLNLDNIPYHLRDNDLYLSRIFAHGPFVLGYKFIFSDPGNTPKTLVPLDIVWVKAKGSENKQVNLYVASGTLEPLAAFSTVVDRSGFVNVRPDEDGVIRRIPLLIGYKDKIYPSLALASVMKAMKVKKAILNVSDEGINALYLDNRSIPLDARGNLLIRFRGEKKAFDYISAIDVLKGDVKKIKDRIVFVGTSATGLKDSYTTPLDTLFPGVEVHATVADNILNTVFLSRPVWTRGLETMVTLVSGVVVSFVLACSSPFLSLVVPGICAIGTWFGALGMLKTGSIFFSPLYPLITIVFCFAILSLLRFRMSEKQSRKRAAEIHRIESELNVAREIQMGVIPKVFPPFPDQDCFDLFASLLPAREVGGDLYDFFFLDEDHLCFTIGDVADKGVPASLFMVITRTLVKNLAPFFHSPADLMTKINDILGRDNPKALFVTLFIGVLDLRTGRVVYANGGHNLPIIFSGSQGIFYKKGISGPVVGAMPDIPYEELSFTLEPGDKIFLYTDGVTEAMDKEKNVFSDALLLKVCTCLEKEPVDQVVKQVLQEVRHHAGTAPQSDDIAMIMLCFHRLKMKKKC